MMNPLGLFPLSATPVKLTDLRNPRGSLKAILPASAITIQVRLVVGINGSLAIFESGELSHHLLSGDSLEFPPSALPDHTVKAEGQGASLLVGYTKR